MMTAANSKSAGPDGPGKGVGVVLLIAAGLTAAFGAAACCALPFLLASAGIGTAWLGGIALIATPYQSLLLAASTICLIGGAVVLWRQQARIACTPNSICTRPAVRGVAFAGLLVGFVLLYLGYIYV